MRAPSIPQGWGQGLCGPTVDATWGSWLRPWGVPIRGSHCGHSNSGQHGLSPLTQPLLAHPLCSTNSTCWHPPAWPGGLRGGHHASLVCPHMAPAGSCQRTWLCRERTAVPSPQGWAHRSPHFTDGETAVGEAASPQDPRVRNWRGQGPGPVSPHPKPLRRTGSATLLETSPWPEYQKLHHLLLAQSRWGRKEQVKSEPERGTSASGGGAASEPPPADSRQ